MKLFIFSFKEHERITKLSALLAQQNLSGVSEVIYVWDDFHPVGKNIHLETCQ